MGKVVDLLNHGVSGAVPNRFWLAAGEPFKLAAGVAIWFLVDRRRDCREPYLLCRGPNFTIRAELPEFVNLHPRGFPVLTIPKAVERDPFGRPQRVLVDFVIDNAIERRKPWL